MPPNTTATVFVPATAGDKVTEGGKPAAVSPGVELLRIESRATVSFGATVGNWAGSAGRGWVGGDMGGLPSRPRTHDYVFQPPTPNTYNLEPILPWRHVVRHLSLPLDT